MNQRFSGVWPAMISPLDGNNRPALDQIDALVELFIQQRLGGIYILGSSGQGLLLSSPERKAIAERVVQAAANRIPVMVHVGCTTTDEAVELARHAGEIGADAVASIAPLYYRLDVNHIFEHYRRIGGAADLPFFIYQIDLVNQPEMPLAAYMSRVLELPNIAGIKVTSADMCQLAQLHNHSEGRLSLFSGTDQILCHAALSGAVGAIGFFFNLWGMECRSAYEAMLSGRVDAARRFMLTFQRATSEFHAAGTWPFLRRAMQRRFAIDIGRPRAPLAIVTKPIDDHHLTSLLQMVEQAANQLKAAPPRPHLMPVAT